MRTILEVQELSKSFKKFKAVDRLSFAIREGEVYGFLGPNGAGKSTTMRMLLGLIFPDSGSIMIDGKPFSNRSRHLLSRIGAIIERPDMYGYLSGWDNLKMVSSLGAGYIPTGRLHEVLEIVGLRGREHDKVKAYSQGMKQRLGIAIAMAHDPDLLILDEPTNGLDPQGIAEMRQLIKGLSTTHKKTVLVSSHLLHEIEQVATSMLIINRGKKVADGKVSDLLNPEETLVEVTCAPGGDVAATIARSAWVAKMEESGKERIVLKMNPVAIPELNRWLVGEGVDVMGISSQHSFEAYFLNMTNDQADTHRTV